MVGDGSLMMFGMSLWWLFWIVVVGLVAAAAIKYLFFHPTRRDRARRDADPDGGRAGPT